jgi:hypothetical protein
MAPVALRVKKTYYQWRLLARAPSGHVGPPPRSGITSSENGCRPTGVSPSEFFAPAAGRLLIGACAFQFVLPAVTVLVKLQNKLALLINKRAAGDLSILVFIKVAEVRVGEGGSSRRIAVNSDRSRCPSRLRSARVNSRSR